MTPRRTTRRTFIVLLAASLSCGWPAAAQPPARRPVVILGVPAEVRDVEARLTRASAERVQGVPFNVGVIGSRDGIIVTGDAFVANPAQRDEMRRSLKASAVEMEGAAVAQVCSQLGVPFIVIRAITDNADGGTIDDYRTNLDAASRNAATLTLAVIADVAVRTK